MTRLEGICGGVLAAVALTAASSASARSDDVVTRHENLVYCNQVARLIINPLRAEGRHPSGPLTLFQAVTFSEIMENIREGRTRGARPAPEIRAEASAVRDRGKAPLHAELRRCWALFNDRPVPDDLIRPGD